MQPPLRPGNRRKRRRASLLWRGCLAEAGATLAVAVGLALLTGATGERAGLAREAPALPAAAVANVGAAATPVKDAGGGRSARQGLIAAASNAPAAAA